MDGKTHAAVGAATALWVLQPKEPLQVALTIGAGAFAGMLPDIDIGQSKASNIMRRVVFGAIIGFSALALHFRWKGITLSQGIVSSKFALVLLGLAILIAYYFYGSKQPHRGFTHSFIATVIVGVSLGLIDDTIGDAAVISYCSHIFVDLFNTKGEQLLWPYNKRWCIGVCKADGVAAIVVRCISYLATVAYAFMLTR